MGTLLRILQSYSTVVTKKYWELEKEELSNLTTFILLSFFLLWNIKGTHSKYFQNNIYETDILSASQRSTTRCSFSVILYTFNVCNISLHLEKLQCVNIKNNYQFLGRHISPGKFIFVKIRG